MVGFGTTLAGIGGAVPEINALQQQQQKQQQERATQALIYQMLQAKQGGGAPGGIQPAPPMPGGPPTPTRTQAPPVAGLPGSSPINAPPPPPSSSGGTSQPPDMFSMALAKIASSNAPDWQKGAAIEQFMQVYAPIANKQEEVRWHDIERQHYDAMEHWAGVNAGAHVTAAGASADNAGNKSNPNIDRLKNEYDKAEAQVQKYIVKGTITDQAGFKAANDKALIAKRKYDAATAGGGGASSAPAAATTADDPLGILGD